MVGKCEIQSTLYAAKKNCYRIFSMQQIAMMDKCSLHEELEGIGELADSDVNEDIGILREKWKCLNSNRYVQFWHDGSSISNHSYLLMAVNCIYDIAIHLTNEEYEMKFRKKVNVQSTIEMPEINIVA